MVTVKNTHVPSFNLPIKLHIDKNSNNLAQARILDFTLHMNSISYNAEEGRGRGIKGLNLLLIIQWTSPLSDNL